MTEQQVQLLLDYIDKSIRMHLTNSPANQSMLQQSMAYIKEQLYELAT